MLPDGPEVEKSALSFKKPEGDNSRQQLDWRMRLIRDLVCGILDMKNFLVSQNW